MFSWYRQWNKFENRSIFDKAKAYEVKAYSKFLGHPIGQANDFIERQWEP